MLHRRILNPFLSKTVLRLLLTLSLVSSSSFVFAAGVPPELKGIGITEKLGSTIEINSLSFLDDEGRKVVLSNYFKKNKPVILALVYYECPGLCNLLLNGLQESLHKLDWTTGNQFELVTVSINPKETPKLAAQKKANYLKIYHRPNAEQGWHFLTGEEAQIQSLASQVGFQYRYDEKEKQYVHSAAIYILTPEGKISRYLYGISFQLKDLRFSLMDAASEKIGTVVDKVLLFCFHFDPSRNSYTLHMWKIVQIILVIQVAGIGAFLYFLWRKDKSVPTR